MLSKHISLKLENSHLPFDSATQRIHREWSYQTLPLGTDLCLGENNKQTFLFFVYDLISLNKCWQCFSVENKCNDGEITACGEAP